MTLCRVPGEGPEMAAGAAPAPLSSRSRSRAPGSGRAAPGGAALGSEQHGQPELAPSLVFLKWKLEPNI